MAGLAQGRGEGEVHCTCGGAGGQVEGRVEMEGNLQGRGEKIFLLFAHNFCLPYRLVILRLPNAYSYTYFDDTFLGQEHIL